MVHGHFGQMLRDELDIVGTGGGDGSAATEQRKHNWASLLHSTAGDLRGSWTHHEGAGPSVACDGKEVPLAVGFTESEEPVAERTDAALHRRPILLLHDENHARLGFGQLLRQGLVERPVESSLAYGCYRDAFDFRSQMQLEPVTCLV